MSAFPLSLPAQGNMPMPGQPDPQPQPQPQQSPQMDPVAMLMEEYRRLDPGTGPAKPMFTPEEANARIDRNNSMASVGMLGSLAGDRGVNSVGAQVFKQALADGSERRTDRGIVDPLSGAEHLDPEYTRALAETRRGQVLQRALAYETSRQNSMDRADAAADRTAMMGAIGMGHDDARIAAAAARGAAGGGGGKEPNLVQIKDDQTGESFWANPKTGEYVKPVTKADGTPLVRPDKPSGTDAKEVTAISTGRAAANMGIQAAMTHPDAFGPMKGLPDQMGAGVIGSAARYMRDNKSLTPDQISARSIIYNNVSQIIKERAGTAQSAQELKRLQGFLPSEMDGAPAIIAKLKAFNQFLDEKGAAIRGNYAGPRPMQHMGGGAAPAAAAPSASGELNFNPATGRIE